MTALSIIMIRQDYLQICGGDHCAAAILSAFEFWTKGKRKSGSAGEVWIYKKQTELQQDLTGLFGIKKIATGLQTLRAKGFLASRSNPHNGQDKILQYRFERDAVDAALGVSESIPDRSEPQLEKSEAAILRSPNAETTPSLITEKTTENLTLLPTEQTATAALRVGAVAVFPTFRPDSEMVDKRTGASESRAWSALEETDRVIQETDVVAAEAPPPVAPPPSPALPEWATLLTGMDAEIAAWLKADEARLRAWCEYAPKEKLGGGFIRVQMRIPGSWPPVGQGALSYIGGPYADFIHH